MLNVSDEVKKIYMSDGIHKEIKIVFPGLNNLTFTNDSIVKDSLSITEGISNSDSLEFVGCIASSLEVEIYDIKSNVKNQEIKVTIKAGDTEEIPLFNGKVDSVEMQTDKRFKKITAYDKLYSLTDKDIASWYRGLDSRTKVKEVRDSLFKYLEIEQVEITLPNDDVAINTYGSPNTLQCIPFIRSICQLNGCFGIINRYNKFEYRFLKPVGKALIPGNIYPGENTIPTNYDTSENALFVSEFYKSIKYEEYDVLSIKRVQIRTTNNDIGVTVGDSDDKSNKYIIQANPLLKGLDEEVLKTIANNVLEKIKDICFHPCEVSSCGLPFIECGDSVTYNINTPYTRQGNYNVDTFRIFNRSFKGSQILNDTYKAEGEEEQKEFISDVGLDLSDYYTKEEVDEKIDNMEEPTGAKVVSCITLPSSRDVETIYLIRGDITII